MVKKKQVVEGALDHFTQYEIYLNVNHLENGIYTLNIVYKNKVIKKTTFKKTTQ